MRITVLVSSAIFDWIYPANTEATEDSELLCISKHNFLKLITENATISIKIIQILSQCLHYKAVMAAEISTQDSEHRLLLLFYCIFNFKRCKRIFYWFDLITNWRFNGFVETVIRTIKILEGELKSSIGKYIGSTELCVEIWKSLSVIIQATLTKFKIMDHFLMRY
jgi:CRP-like cAMP-binding protein